MKQYYKRHEYAVNIMYDNLSKLIKNQTFLDKKIYMFGTSKIACMIIAYLQDHQILLNGIIDNNEKKQGYEIDGLIVNKPEVLEEFDPGVIVLIASSYQDEMIGQLEKMGYKYGINIIKVIDLPELMNDYSFADRKNYKEMSGEEIRKRQIAIMKHMKNVCEQNKIDYYLAYGTLLGAVRHKGFIPWDDDVDIWVKGKDIDRLAELINQGDRYQMITCKNNDQFLDQLPIIVDTYSVMDINMFPLQASTGVWIDVFPLYGIPSDKEEVKEYASRVKKMEMDKWRYLYDDNKCHQYAIKLYEFISSYDLEQSEYTGYFLNSEFTSDYYKTKNFERKEYLMFEGEEFCVPGGYDEILTSIYNDYMALPPKEKRVSSHYYKVYFNHESNSTEWEAEIK